MWKAEYVVYAPDDWPEPGTVIGGGVGEGPTPESAELAAGCKACAATMDLCGEYEVLPAVPA